MFADDGKILVGEIDGAFSVWDPAVAASFDRLAAAAESARVRIGAGRGAALDWNALGDWFASRGVCIEAVQSYDRGRSLGSVTPLPRYAQCLWSLGHAERAKQELHVAVLAGLLPASYAELLIQAPQTKDRISAE